MKPQSYAIGLALTISLSLGLYATLLSYFGVPPATLGAVLVTTTIVMTTMGVQGYRRWRSSGRVTFDGGAEGALLKRLGSIVRTGLTGFCAIVTVILWSRDSKLWAAMALIAGATILVWSVRISKRHTRSEAYLVPWSLPRTILFVLLVSYVLFMFMAAVDGEAVTAILFGGLALSSWVAMRLVGNRGFRL